MRILSSVSWPVLLAQLFTASSSSLTAREVHHEMFDAAYNLFLSTFFFLSICYWTHHLPLATNLVPNTINLQTYPKKVNIHKYRDLVAIFFLKSSRIGRLSACVLPPFFLWKECRNQPSGIKNLNKMFLHFNYFKAHHNLKIQLLSAKATPCKLLSSTHRVEWKDGKRWNWENGKHHCSFQKPLEHSLSWDLQVPSPLLHKHVQKHLPRWAEVLNTTGYLLWWCSTLILHILQQE